MNVGDIRPASKTWRLLAVFTLALVVRLVYNLYMAQHRIMDVGDSFYYLTAGRSLARLVRESQFIHMHSFFSQLCTAAQYIPGSFNSFSALGLSDRLLIDGPVYPSYLAMIFLLAGKALETTALNVNQLTFALANSCTDALLAAAILFLGETAFGTVAGVLAGVLWCFYFPAIVNTQQCYGEPVVALLLTLFVSCMFLQSRQCDQLKDISKKNGQETKHKEGINKADSSQHQGINKAARSPTGLLLSLLLGGLAGLVMLAKPAFILLPPLLLAIHLIFLAYSGRLRQNPYSAASLMLGVMLVIAPWLVYTSTVSGAPRLVVNRAPGYNLYIGNYLPTDGWKTWPVVAGVPDSVADASRFIESEASAQPLAVASLLLRKIPRLWAGVWNDFHLTCFGFSYVLQNVFQAMYLLLATLALAVFCAGRFRQTRPYSFAAAATMAFAIAFHFIYVAFEPVPRYAFTAMPLVLTLASGGLIKIGQGLFAVSKKLRQRTALKLLFLFLLFALVGAALYTFKAPLSLWLPFTQDAASLRLLSGLTMFVFFILIGTAFVRPLRRLKLAGPFTYFICAKSFILAGLIALAGALSDPAYLEWSFKLPSLASGGLGTAIALPDLGKSVPAKVYLLVDAQSDSGAPALNVTINGKSASTYPLPLYEFTAAAKDIPTIMNLQGHMMDLDQRTFRQWWIYPVDAKLFHFGADNIVTLFKKNDETKIVQCFGDYRPPRPDSSGETLLLPSLTTFSWSKGFLTADCRDPRVYEETFFRGRSKNSWAILSDHSSRALVGALRLRLAVPMLGVSALPTPAALEPISLLSMPQVQQISGQNPVVFDSPKVVLPAPLTASSILHIQGQLRRSNPTTPATMAVTFDFGPTKPAYSPIWQPSCLRLKSKWGNFDFKTVLPANTKTWQNFTTHLLLSPYPGDKLYLHRKEALRDSIFVRDLKIEILPPPVPGSAASGLLKLI